MKKKMFASGCILLCLAACSAVRPISGRMERSDETFSGTVSGSGYQEGHGDLHLVSSSKATCDGGFTYTSRRKGAGVLRCSDGRSGTFQVVGVNAQGSGFGELGGQRFTFTFSDPG